MKLSWSAIFSSLYCSAAASKAGHVFVYDPVPNPAPQAPSEVSPETARLILAQRLGLSRFHSIENPNDELIQQLNKYGGSPQQLFAGKNDVSRTNAHVLVWIEDVDDIGGIIKDESAYSAAFTITNPPSPSDNDRLIQDMISQAESLPKRADPKGWAYTVGIETEAALQPIKKTDTYKDWLSVFRADKTDKPFTELSKILDTHLSKSISAESQRGWPITVVLMPPSSSHSKRATHPYGTYDLPSTIEARREKTEALLSPSSSQPSTQPQSPNISDLEDFPTIQQNDDYDSPVLGILPTCFESQAKCEKQTHNCSGHGSCGMLREGAKGKDGTSDCYGCTCKETRVKVGDEKGMENPKLKVTYWGGPACQKKDVSTPFWLFVGTGVLLASLISSGIGMLYSMGAEELPSVIGAGVSGPVRK